MHLGQMTLYTVRIMPKNFRGIIIGLFKYFDINNMLYFINEMDYCFSVFYDNPP